MREEKGKKVVFIVGLFLLDRFSKLLAIRLGVFSLNKGIAFGIEPPLPAFFVIIPLILVSLSYIFWGRRLGAALIIVSAFSNLIDRLIYGGVVDFIKLPGVGILNNFSDFFIFSGFILLLVDLFCAARVS